MKKNLLFFIVFILIISYNLYSQEAYDARFFNAHPDTPLKTKYYVTVQIKAPTVLQAYKMGNANISFNYNKINLSNPVVFNKFTNFSGGAYATLTVTMPITGMVSINIVYYDAAVDDASATLVDTNWKDVATVEFTLLDPTGCGDFVFRNFSDALVPYLINNGMDIDVARNSVINLSACPLPVELLYFNASPVGRSAVLDWSTASEINNYGFDVQRYNDVTQEWDFVSFVLSKATGGNSQKQLNYDLIDENIYNVNLGPKTYYYRLKQIDINGSFEYSEVRSVSFNPNAAMEDISINIFPNPVKNVLFVEILNLHNLNPFDLLIYDKYGKLQSTDRFRRKTQVDVSKLPQGSYSITVRNEKHAKTETFTIAR